GVVNGNLLEQVSHLFRSFTQEQAALFDRLEAAQPYPILAEAKGGEFRITLFCKEKDPQKTPTGYRYVPVGVRWDLHRQIRPGFGGGAGGTPDLFLPLSLPDDRR